MPDVLATTDYATLTYEVDEVGQLFLHLDLREFSLSVAKRIRKDFQEVLDFLKEKGYQEVFVLIPESDSFLHKFERFLGFKTMTTADGIRVLHQET